VIKAAGGLVIRDGCVLLVHRPKYDDWSFPKGKLERGESWEDAALREVEEEASLRCELGEYVASTHYEVRGEPKEVRYYRLTSPDDPRAQNEVDEVRWATFAEAHELLTYDHDRELLDQVPGTS
jgi:8-oxo-dGTP pyrophosphatase MutT (NUDIX family)